MGHKSIESDVRRAFAGSRVSDQRRSIVHAISTIPGAFSTEHLVSAVQQVDERVAVGTVYRAVMRMVETGYLQHAGESDGAALHVRCADSHAPHHHAVCEQCGAVTCIDCLLDEDILRTMRESGFSITRHDLTVYGLCADCRGETE